jgi:homoserine O-acetyltransferase/O-succinyltransferase
LTDSALTRELGLRRRGLRRRGLRLASAAAIGGVVAVLVALFGTTPRQQFAHIGDFRLESGTIIRDAVIGYRTAGTLNQSRSNAVLVAPWFQGTTRQLARQIGPGKLIDTSKYFVIMVDAIGNGVSSSPSNSTAQPDDKFPAFTIADIVESQHHLVARVLGLTHLHAVVGISMGGMQVFQWTVAHPDYMDKAVAIAGSPWSQPDDQERCRGIINWARTPITARVRDAMARWKPRTAINELLMEPHDQIRQAQAMMNHDIRRTAGGAGQRVHDTPSIDLLIVGTWGDREVNPAPAFELAALVGAEVIELDGRCGHQAPSCEREILWPAVARFLDG